MRLLRGEEPQLGLDLLGMRCDQQMSLRQAEGGENGTSSSRTFTVANLVVHERRLAKFGPASSPLAGLDPRHLCLDQLHQPGVDLGSPSWSRNLHRSSQAREQDPARGRGVEDGPGVAERLERVVLDRESEFLVELLERRVHRLCGEPGRVGLRDYVPHGGEDPLRVDAERVDEVGVGRDDREVPPAVTPRPAASASSPSRLPPVGTKQREESRPLTTPETASTESTSSRPVEAAIDWTI